MRLIKGILRFLISRRLWTFIGLALICAAIWYYGALIEFAGQAPLETDLVRGLVIAGIAVLWLFSLLLAQLRAARRNQMFVTELSAPAPKPKSMPGDPNVTEINNKFQDILQSMKRSKLGNKKFLRDMPWYVIIGPPGTGKTTALRQSGLHFPIDLSDDIKGVGGTRNCDWFFTETAVLVDTAGRYVQQMSDPEVDAAEWRGFLDMLKKHRGKRALNGVIVCLSMKELLGPDGELRNHGREIRKRLAELRERLEIQLPVYLMVTKSDLVPGFEPFFADLTTQDREQVWGATLATDARPDSAGIARESRALLGTLEGRLSARMAEDAALPWRAEVFRFPAQMEKVESPLKVLIDTVFGESRYEESPWLRGFYFTSATQEGSPIDRMIGEMAQAFGLRTDAPQPRAYGQSRSYFLRNMLTDVIFPEAGLGLFDRAAEERRKWLWRGSITGAALICVLAGLAFLYSYLRASAGVDEQARQLADLSGRLSNVAARQAPTEPLDLDLALEAVTAVDATRGSVASNVLTLAGPSAAPEMARAHRVAYERSLRNILEPRMVALLEATMWQNVRDPDFMFGALKAYYMLTGLAPYDKTAMAQFWQNDLKGRLANVDPFPTEAALAHQLAAIDRMAGEERRIAPDKELVAAALDSICTVPLAQRAYNALKQDPNVVALPEWVPSEKAGPNAARVLTRLSGKTLRVGLPGAYTYAGFHGVVVPLIPDVAAQFALDRAVFAGGCPESSEASVATLEADMMKLYSDDYMAQWDGFLRDIRLAKLEDLTMATANLKDLAGNDSTLKRLLKGIVAETDLTRVIPEGEEDPAIPKGVVGAATKKLGKIGSLVTKGSKLIGSGDDDAPAELPGKDIASHFAPLKSMVEEVDGVPPLIDDLQAALDTISKELLTVSATPNPEAALAARGGLAIMTGGLANVAATLPDPVDDWIATLAGQTVALARDAVVAELNARWRADVLPFCQKATDGRFPFQAKSAIDVSLSDFARLFGPDQLIDTFVKTNLLQYVDTSGDVWQWRSDFGLDAATLKPFQQAAKMRNGLFVGATGPVMSFTLIPKDLQGASRMTLNLDGQQMVYTGAPVPMGLHWPGDEGTNLITLTFAPLDGGTEIIANENGAWAWLRLLRKAKLSKTDQADLFRLRLAMAGVSADFDLQAGSVDNPFDLSMFGNFKCPESF